MRRHQQEVGDAFPALVFWAVAAAAGLPLAPVEAASTSGTAIESIVIEGSVSGGSTINNTINKQDPAVLAAMTKTFADQMAASSEAKAQAEGKAAELATKLGFTSAAVVEFFKILGEQDVPEQKVPARLIEVALHFAQTRDALATLAPDDPHTAELARSAKEVLDSGRLTEADILLDQAREGELAALRQARELKQKAQEAEDRHALNAAKLLAGRGNIALTQLRYVEAAERFKQATVLVPSGHPHELADYLHRQADALYRQGDEQGDNAALRKSIETWHLVLEQRTRERVPLEWAMTQNNLGNTFEALGERESGTARLEEAVAAYRAALEEYPRERVPLEWAITQNNLGNALEALGERESGTARLEEAVATYRAALEERTRERVPLEWAMTQNNLGNALRALGERESGTARLEEAVAAYRAALEEYPRERVPLKWAKAQMNLGAALETLGEQENGTAHLEEAVAAYRATLEEYPRERVPLKWAMTQHNLGNALEALGERESGTARLEEAVAAYHLSLEERTRERVPIDWAVTQYALGIALQALGNRESGMAGLEALRAAVAAWEACLTIAPPEWVQSVKTRRDETQAEIGRRSAK
jgi:tetratricopeptide (TPR) repeat protein